jgi:hypothetical protein
MAVKRQLAKVAYKWRVATSGSSCLEMATVAYTWQQLLTDGKKMQPIKAAVDYKWQKVASPRCNRCLHKWQHLLTNGSSFRTVMHEYHWS